MSIDREMNQITASILKHLRALGEKGAKVTLQDKAPTDWDLWSYGILSGKFGGREEYVFIHPAGHASRTYGNVSWVRAFEKNDDGTYSWGTTSYFHEQAKQVLYEHLKLLQSAGLVTLENISDPKTKRETLFCKISPNFTAMQRALGVSLTALAESGGDSIIVKPQRRIQHVVPKMYLSRCPL
jgi:hypothetical protein